MFHPNSLWMGTLDRAHVTCQCDIVQYTRFIRGSAGAAGVGRNLIGPASIPRLAVALSDSSPRSGTVMHTSRAVAGALPTRRLVSWIVIGKSAVSMKLQFVLYTCDKLLAPRRRRDHSKDVLLRADRHRQTPTSPRTARQDDFFFEILVAPRSMPLRACKKSVVCSLSPSIRFILSAHCACRPVHMIPTAGLRQSPPRAVPGFGSLL